MWKNTGLRPDPHITKKKKTHPILFILYYFAMPEMLQRPLTDDVDFLPK